MSKGPLVELMAVGKLKNNLRDDDGYRTEIDNG